MFAGCGVLVALVTLLVVSLSALYSSLSEMTAQRKFTAQRGFFSHDEDPDSWDFRTTTRVNLGLLDRSYPTDDNAGDLKSQDGLTQWERFRRYVQHLNANNGKKQYKLLYLVRHGEGLHNVKEKEVGRAEWDVSLLNDYEEPHVNISGANTIRTRLTFTD